MNTFPTFRYEKTVGCWGRIAHPVDVKVHPRNGWMYVLNRSTAWHAPHGRAVGIVVVDQEEKVIASFGGLGTEPGQLFMPTALALGSDGRVYVADEHINAISVFTEDGTFIERWGSTGSGPGEWNRPSGLAFDSAGQLLVVDHVNGRVQRFTSSGTFVDAFGSPGSGPGEFRLAWGIAIDREDRMWVADWGNDRIQSFSPDGRCEMVIGGTAGEGATFSRPAGIAVDEAANVFVTDWGNDRVLVFDHESNHMATWQGDSALSKWAIERIEEFPVFAEQRKASGLYDQERRFWRPAGITALSTGRVFVVDSCRHRIQVYQRESARAA